MMIRSVVLSWGRRARTPLGWLYVYPYYDYLICAHLPVVVRQLRDDGAVGLWFQLYL